MANLSVLMLWPGLIVSGSMASRLASALMGAWGLWTTGHFSNAWQTCSRSWRLRTSFWPSGHENVWDCWCHKQSCRSSSRGGMNRCRATGWRCYILPTSMLDPTVVHKETKIQYLAYLYPSQPLFYKGVNTALKLIIVRQALFNT